MSTDFVEMYGVMYEFDFFRIFREKRILKDPNAPDNIVTIKFKAKYSTDIYTTFSGDDWSLMVLGQKYGGGSNPGMKYIKNL